MAISPDFLNLANVIVGSTGTGSTINLGAVVPGWKTFADAGGITGRTYWYIIEPQDALRHEIGYAVLDNTVPRLTGRTVLSSTEIANAPLNLDGTERIYSGPVAHAPRHKLTENTTFYVATTGSDVTGDGSAGLPWASPQHAYDTLANNYDFGGFNVAVQCGDGTYTLNTGSSVLEIQEEWTGGGFLTFNGNAGDRTAVRFENLALSGAALEVDACTISNLGVNNIQLFIPDASGWAAVSCNFVGQLGINNCDISGGSALVDCSNYVSGQTVKFFGTFTCFGPGGFNIQGAGSLVEFISCAIEIGAGVNASDDWFFIAYGGQLSFLFCTFSGAGFPMASAGITLGPDGVARYIGTTLPGANDPLFFGGGALFDDNVNNGATHGLNRVLDSNVNYQTPITGFSLTLNDLDWHVVLNPATMLASGTITMPPAPFDGQIIHVKTSRMIAALSVLPNAGQFIVNPPAGISGGGFFEATYRQSTSTWHCSGRVTASRTLITADTTFYIGYLFGTIAGGSGYTDGLYTDVAFTGGAGTGARANIRVTAGAVTMVQIYDLTTVPTGYVIGNVLSAASGDIGGGSGFTFTLTGVGSNTSGNGTATQPYATPQGGYDAIQSIYDFAGFDITLQFADTHFTINPGNDEFCLFTVHGWVGNGTLTVRGNLNDEGGLPSVVFDADPANLDTSCTVRANVGADPITWTRVRFNANTNYTFLRVNAGINTIIDCAWGPNVANPCIQTGIDPARTVIAFMWFMGNSPAVIFNGHFIVAFTGRLIAVPGVTMLPNVFAELNTPGYSEVVDVFYDGVWSNAGGSISVSAGAYFLDFYTSTAPGVLGTGTPVPGQPAQVRTGGVYDYIDASTFTGATQIGISGANDSGRGYFTPTTGQTIQIDSGVYHNVINPAGTLAALTINMPQLFPNMQGLNNGQLAKFIFAEAITSLTFTSSPDGDTLKNAPTTIAAGKHVDAIYDLATTTWFFTT